MQEANMQVRKRTVPWQQHGNTMRHMNPSNNAENINENYNCKRFWRQFLGTCDIPRHNHHTSSFLCTNMHCPCHYEGFRYIRIPCIRATMSAACRY